MLNGVWVGSRLRIKGYNNKKQHLGLSPPFYNDGQDLGNILVLTLPMTKLGPTRCPSMNLGTST